LTLLLLDIDLWYSNGPGGVTVAAQGIGYVQELVSRLSQTRITEFNTAVNQTVVSSNITFPFNQPIYVDASHDTTITASTCNTDSISLTAQLILI
jgi:hypothetical protein